MPKSELFTLKSDKDGIAILFENKPFAVFTDPVRATRAMFFLTKQVEPLMGDNQNAQI